MACNCGSKRRAAGSATYRLTTPEGKNYIYSTQVEAEAAKARLGGTVTKQ